MENVLVAANVCGASMTASTHQGDGLASTPSSGQATPLQEVHNLQRYRHIEVVCLAGRADPTCLCDDGSGTS